MLLGKIVVRVFVFKGHMLLCVGWGLMDKYGKLLCGCYGNKMMIKTGPILSFRFLLYDKMGDSKRC